MWAPALPTTPTMLGRARSVRGSLAGVRLTRQFWRAPPCCDQRCWTATSQIYWFVVRLAGTFNCKDAAPAPLCSLTALCTSRCLVGCQCWWVCEVGWWPGGQVGWWAGWFREGRLAGVCLQCNTQGVLCVAAAPAELCRADSSRSAVPPARPQSALLETMTRVATELLPPPYPAIQCQSGLGL